MILVIGATGTVGSRLVEELRQRGQHIRALVRSKERGESLGERIDLAIGDLADRPALDAAMAGVDQVFLVSPNQPEQVELETAAIQSATRANVKRIVKVSAAGARIGSTLPFWDWQARIEQVLSEAGIPSVVLRPTFYMSGLLRAADGVREHGTLFAPAGQGHVAMIDPADVARVGAAALLDGANDGKILELTGPSALGHADIAVTLSNLMGRDIQYVDVPPAAAREQMVAGGLSPFIADALLELFRLLADGAQDQVTGTVSAVTGTAPTTVADFLAANVGAFR